MIHSKPTRALLGAGSPLVAFAVQHAAWSAVHHFTCLLFYPAVFLASWVGGVFSGLVATSLSVVLVLAFLPPPEGNTDPANLLSLGVFIGMGVLFTVFHERLRNANQRAAAAWEQVNRLREEWAAVVAHDLQQPINAIGIRADLLLRTPASDAQHEDAEQIRIAAKRLSRMARDLLDASQLEANRMTLARERLDLGRLVREIVARDPSIALRARVSDSTKEPLWIDGDAERLEQAVGNILTNAVKYGEPSTPIDVRIDQMRHRVRISIANQGPGIDPELVPTLFQRYARSRAATCRTKGTGLGLYITKGLVEAHGGRITVESIPEKKTTFRITLPLAEAPQTDTVALGRS